MSLGKVLLALARRIGEVIAAAASGLAPRTGPVAAGLRHQLGEVQQRVAVGLVVLSALGLVTIANRETFVARPYHDGAGVMTNGYGNTHNVDPKKAVTPERALLDLLHNSDAAADAIRRCVHVKAYQYEFDAWVALAVNVGVGAFCKSSGNPDKPNLVDLINAERYAEACDRMLSFNKVRNPKTGQLEVSAGLTRFREQERRMCLGETP